jgi:hypothetical protein
MPLIITAGTQARFGSASITRSGTHVQHTPRPGLVSADLFTCPVANGQRDSNQPAAGGARERACVLGTCVTGRTRGDA